MSLPGRARSVDGMNLQPHGIRSRLAVMAAAGLAVAASASAGQLRHHSGACYSELVSCGLHGVSGTRAQFVEAVTRPVDQPFLRRLPH